MGALAVPSALCTGLQTLLVALPPPLPHLPRARPLSTGAPHIRHRGGAPSHLQRAAEGILTKHEPSG